VTPRLSKESNGRYYVRYSAAGRSQRQSLRTADPDIAEARFGEWLRTKGLGFRPSADPTIGTCAELYMAQWGKMRNPKVGYSIRKLLMHFQNWKVSELNRQAVDEYVHRRTVREQFAQNTVRHEVLTLRTVLNFMARKVEPVSLRLPPHVIPYFPIPQAGPPRDRVLSPEEVDMVKAAAWSAVDGEGRWTRVARFIWLAVESAQRMKAITDLTWDRVDLKRGLIQFEVPGREKTNKRRPLIPMSDELKRGLFRMEAEKNSNYVLDTRQQISIRKFILKLGLEDVTPHTFRHTWASHAVERGVDLAVVAAFLGDTMQTVEKHYLHLSPNYLRAAFAVR
jgi:integrase